MSVIVFDLDDTLYLEADYARSGFRFIDSALKQEGVSGFYERAWQRFTCGERTQMFDVVLPELGLVATAERVAKLVEMFRNHQPDIELAPDAAWLLDRWAGQRTLGLITDGKSVTQHRKIDALQLRDRLDCVVVSDDLGGEKFWKPSPAPFRAVMGALGSERTFTYVGDNPFKDFITARQLGWKTVRIRRAGGLHARVESDPEHAAECEIDDLRALSQLLDPL